MEFTDNRWLRYAVRFRFAGIDSTRNQISDPYLQEEGSRRVYTIMHPYAAVQDKDLIINVDDIFKVRDVNGTYYVDSVLNKSESQAFIAQQGGAAKAFKGRRAKPLSSYDDFPCIEKSNTIAGRCYNSNHDNVKIGSKTSNTAQLLEWDDYLVLADHFERIREYIANHESAGDYEANNLGKVGVSVDTRKVFGKLITEMTMKEFRAQQNDSGGILFATGKYQIIPETLRDAMASLNIPDDTKYDTKTQDALCVYLAITKRKHLGAYLMGKSDDLVRAGNDLSFEWAFAPLLGKYTTQKGTFQRGQSIYQGDKAGNKTNPNYVVTLESALVDQKSNIISAYLSDPALQKIVDKYGS